MSLVAFDFNHITGHYRLIICRSRLVLQSIGYRLPAKAIRYMVCLDNTYDHLRSSCQSTVIVRHENDFLLHAPQKKKNTVFERSSFGINFDMLNTAKQCYGNMFSIYYLCAFDTCWRRNKMPHLLNLYYFTHYFCARFVSQIRNSNMHIQCTDQIYKRKCLHI